MRSRHRAKYPLALIAVAALGVAAGAFSLFYATTAWLALAPFVLATWISPAPRLTALLVTATLAAACVLAILGHLPGNIQDFLALATGVVLTWASALILGHKNQQSAQTFSGLRQLIQASPVGLVLLNDEHKIILDNTAASRLLGCNDASLDGLVIEEQE